MRKLKTEAVFSYIYSFVIESNTAEMPSVISLKFTDGWRRYIRRYHKSITDDTLLRSSVT